MFDLINLSLALLFTHIGVLSAQNETIYTLDNSRVHIPAVTQPSIIFTPPADIFPISTEPSTTAANSPPIPDSLIGYDIPCGKRNNDYDTRIVGGTFAIPGEFPWQVSIQLISGGSNRHICGGSVISKRWVVTAAHCMVGLQPAQVLVVAGEHNLHVSEGTEQRLRITRILRRNYVPGTFTNDIALLLTAKDLRLDGKSIAPVCVPKPSDRYTKGYGVVSGWGRIAEGGVLPNLLQYVSLPIFPKGRCRQLYRNAGYGAYLSRCQMCAGLEEGGMDACQGDSGGPLVCKKEDGLYYLCGIVSWGVGCARPHFPGVYTEVPCFSSWISDVLYGLSQ